MIAWVGEEVERVKALFDQKVSGWLLPVRTRRLRCCPAVCCTCRRRDCCPNRALFIWLSYSQEAHLTADRDAARTAAAELRGERDALAAVVQQAEAQVASLGRQLQEEQVCWWLGLHGCVQFVGARQGLVLCSCGTEGWSSNLLPLCPAAEQARARAAADAAERHRGQAAAATSRVAEVEEELREVRAAGASCGRLGEDCLCSRLLRDMRAPARRQHGTTRPPPNPCPCPCRSCQRWRHTRQQRQPSLGSCRACWRRCRRGRCCCREGLVVSSEQACGFRHLTTCSMQQFSHPDRFQHHASLSMIHCNVTCGVDAKDQMHGLRQQEHAQGGGAEAEWGVVMRI